jgi:hypothetical protein
MSAPTDRARHLIVNHAIENDRKDYNVEKINNCARCGLLKARAGSGAELGPHGSQKLGALCLIDFVLHGSAAAGGLVCAMHLVGCISHAFDRHSIGGARRGAGAAEIGPDCGGR